MPLCPRESRYALFKSLRGLQTPVWTLWSKDKSLASAGNWTLAVQSIVRPYTGWAISDLIILIITMMIASDWKFLPHPSRNRRLGYLTICSCIKTVLPASMWEINYTTCLLLPCYPKKPGWVTDPYDSRAPPIIVMTIQINHCIRTIDTFRSILAFEDTKIMLCSKFTWKILEYAFLNNWKYTS
jgi:hypothetical protein